mmetsp:Transcript_12366/g.20773  ORF Transcript_12366/g.20773 Transcript_12366/m.20773 type:complete len:85 (-) Transcript_12366:308-562(-)
MIKVELSQKLNLQKLYAKYTKELVNFTKLTSMELIFAGFIGKEGQFQHLPERIAFNKVFTPVVMEQFESLQCLSIQFINFFEAD